MRALSLRQALNCETATTPATRCRCRCGGALHGANRQAHYMLAEGDPHNYRTDEEKRERRNRRRRMKRRERRTGMDDLFKPLES